MIRILHFAGIINRYDFIDSVLTRLDRSKFELSALTLVPPRRAEAFADGEAYPTQMLNIPYARRNFGRMLTALLKEIGRFRPHILHAHHYDENLVAALAVRLAHVPGYVVGHHYSDHIYYLTRGVKRRVVLAGESFCNRVAQRIVVPIPEVARILTEQQHVSPAKVTVIPFALDFERYRPSSPAAPARVRREHNLEGKYLILTCCRLNPEKGLDHLLRALPTVRSRAGCDFCLVMVGSGPHESELRRLRAELGLSGLVSFVGWRDDALDWIAAADLVVQPSLCESFCQVLFEALALEKPVIMTPVGAAPEVIGDNERGRLVPTGDSESLARAIIELMKSRELGACLGARGRDYILEHMTAERSARLHEQMYEAAVQSAPAPM